MVQCKFFYGTNQKHVFRKIGKIVRFLAVLREYNFSNVGCVVVDNISESS